MRRLLLALAAAGRACASSGDAPRDLGADLGPPEPQDRFGVHLTTAGGDNTGLLLLVDDVEANAELDLSRGLTLSPSSTAVGSPFAPDRVFIFDGASPQITRYRVGPGDAFEAEETLAFPRFLTPPRFVGPAHFVFIDARRAYLFDPFGEELIVWDPVDLVVTGRVPVPTEDVPGPNLLPLPAVQTAQVGTRVIYPISFANSFDDAAHPRTLVAVLDTTTDTLETLLVTERCGYLRDVFATSTRDVYLGTDIFSTAVHVASEGERAGPSCVLRLDIETLTLDDTPVLVEGDDLGGRPGGSFAFVADDRAFVRTLDPDALPADTTLTTLDLTNGAFWRWGFVANLDPVSFRFVEGAPLGPAFTRTYTVRDLRLTVDRTPAGGSQLTRIRPDGTRTPGVRTGQTILYVFPLRF